MELHRPEDNEALQSRVTEGHDSLPEVSVVIPMRNEEGYIRCCLDSIVEGDYPRHRMEVLVVDGMSEDRSREIVLEYAGNHPPVRLLDNHQRIVSTALNIGIRAATGEIVVRADAHTLYAPDYVNRCVELLQTTEADNVGGVQRAVGTDWVSNAVAIGTTTPFGTGGAKFRHAQQSSWVPTVYLGAWRRSTLERLGGFSEEWAANEDYELNYRLRQAGGRILLSPDIKCWYYVRPSLVALARQYLRYGFWKAKTFLVHSRSLQWRQLAPPALVAGLLLSLALLPVSVLLASALPALYLTASLIAATSTARRRGWRYLPLLPLVFAAIHLSWGTGFLVGLFRWGVGALCRGPSPPVQRL